MNELGATFDGTNLVVYREGFDAGPPSNGGTDYRNTFALTAVPICDSGDWSTDITMWTPDITTLTCPEGICADAGRSYTISDFRNGGGNIADLSNVRAFSVVPIPAAVWLFGSALAGMFGWSKRKAVLKTS